MTQKKKIQKKNKNLQFSRKCEVKGPEDWNGFSIHRRDWDRIIDLAKNIKNPSKAWQNFGWWSFGVSASAGLSAAAEYFKVDQVLSTFSKVLIAFTILFLVVGILSMIFHKEINKVSVQTKESLIKEMKNIEKASK